MFKSLGFVIMFSVFAGSLMAKEMTFGEPVNESLLTEISTILKTPEQFIDKPVTISGTIVNVCSKRGCWMELASDAKFEKLRIKVNDGDMVFPLTAKGQTALATGTLKTVQLDLEQTRNHQLALAKRRGQKLDPTTITQTMAIYQLTPTAVKILD